MVVESCPPFAERKREKENEKGFLQLVVLSAEVINSISKLLVVVVGLSSLAFYYVFYRIHFYNSIPE